MSTSVSYSNFQVPADDLIGIHQCFDISGNRVALLFVPPAITVYANKRPMGIVDLIVVFNQLPSSFTTSLSFMPNGMKFLL